MTNEVYFKEERDKIVKGLEEVYQRLVKFKQMKNSPLVVIREGEIVFLDPNNLPESTTYQR